MAIDIIQEQVHNLSNKVDSLHRLVEQLSDQVAALALVQGAPVPPAMQNGKGAESAAVEVSPAVSAARSSMDMAMSHKDILNDETSLDGDKSSATASLSPEIQVQRLTAQLTAAYNRMAVLEEQILACRFH